MATFCSDKGISSENPNYFLESCHPQHYQEHAELECSCHYTTKNLNAACREQNGRVCWLQLRGPFLVIQGGSNMTGTDCV